MYKKLICPALLLLVLGVVVGQAAEVKWIRAAWWDGRYPTNWADEASTVAVRDGVVTAGYELLDSDQLKTWMDARIADKKLSVVVFCRDIAPDTVIESMSASCTLRRYLDAGGKIVFYADIPFYNQGHADGTSTNWAEAGANAILGIGNVSVWDTNTQTVITPMGTRWGLTQTWASVRPYSPSGLTVLATDGSGDAAAWVKHFVPNDSYRGFVRLWDRGGRPPVEDIIRVAEYIGLKAGSPSPADGEVGVTAPLLTWMPGGFALFHDVYLGTTPDLTEADCVSPHQLFTMYYHVPGLEPGATYYWRIDEIEADGLVRTGDLWTFVAQDVIAYHPDPADGATDAAQTPMLTWLPGQTALTHHVYFGDDADAVAQGAADTDKGEFTDPNFAPGDLDSLSTYYWRVDETIVDGTVRTGSVWSFTTCLSVDDFESYTDDEGSRIYETWIDGWTNGTGSTVGNVQAPFAEQTIVHSGLQSMPLDYNNVNSPFYSEAELEFGSTQNWTAGGADTLILYVRGGTGNDSVPLYVALEDSSGHVAVVTYPDTDIMATATWTQWKIPLSDFAGVNAARVQKMYVGLGDRDAPVAGGAGRIYIDDIQVTKP